MINPVASSVSAASLQGMQKAETQLNTTANKIAQFPQNGGDTLDLSSDMVSLISSRDNFMANVGAAKTGDAMQRAALNMIA
ncbi:MAG: hypothetical protein ABSH09_24810 [Bryobacteraceae bacterium]|jgi:flagellar hook protein FlgE